MLSFLNNLGPGEIIIIAVILVVLFGAGKLGNLGKTAGETTKEIKKAKKEFENAIKETKSEIEDESEVS